ncbi:hypothetical protein PQX77_020172 [Marasmius sp. AFHP31]|nr:hypothetical protein PQX77_020172 [Marasmius sp. AFHP31]
MNGLEDAQRIIQDVLNSEHKYRQIIEAKGDDAQKCLDLLQVLAERLSITTELRPSILKMMLRLSKRSGLCPKCLVVRNVKKPRGYPVGSGGFGDVYKEAIGEQAVCLKVARIFQDSEDSSIKNLIKEYMKEAIVWKQLEHPNLLPFIGMYYLDEGHHQLCLISPWMDRGDLTRYLKRTPREQVNRLVLAYDVAAGLSYLHDKKIVHGDLKGLNVLINADERALIGDFGLSRVVEAHAPGLFTSTTGAKGTTRWSSPELLDWVSPCSTSIRSDVYAYACVCYEIFTGKQPFYKLQHDGAVINAVLNKKYPDRLEEAEELNDQLWEIMVSCWQHDQYLRPSAADVLARIGEITNTKTGTAVRLQSSLDLSYSDRVQYDEQRYEPRGPNYHPTYRPKNIWDTVLPQYYPQQNRIPSSLTPPGQYHVPEASMIMTTWATQRPWPAPLTPLADIPVTMLDGVRHTLLGQLEYYLSEENMAKDTWLRRKMSSDGWIPLSFIAGFHHIKQLTDNLGLVREVLRYSEHIEVSDDQELKGVRVRMRDERWKKFLLPPPGVVSSESPQDGILPVMLPVDSGVLQQETDESKGEEEVRSKEEE